MAIISISRQFGAGGRSLAEKITQCLGYEFADEELVARVAKAANVSDEWIRVTERESHSGSKGLVSGLFSTVFLKRLIGESTGGYRGSRLSSLFESIIPEIAERGNVIFLGRGSQFILPERSDIIKILLVAPEEFRINFMMETHHLDREEARKAVGEWEENRTAFISELTTKNPNDPSIYHLVFNTGVVRQDWVCNIICRYAENKDKTGKGA